MKSEDFLSTSKKRHEGRLKLSDKLSHILKKEYHYHGDIDGLLEQLNLKQTAKIRRSGHSLCVTIPARWLQKLNWQEHDPLLLQLDKSLGRITLQKPKLQEK
jgi:hypothetical protein